MSLEALIIALRQFSESQRVSLRLGDCVQVMAQMSPESVDAIVCDPPYDLGFMGKQWDRLSRDFHETWARQALRLLKPGGFLLAFGGTRTYHRMVSGIEDAGFEIRDSVHWIYGSGFPKSGTALKPAHEPIVLARKPVVGSVARNVLAYGTGGINVDKCRVSFSSNSDKKSAKPQGQATSKDISAIGAEPDAGRNLQRFAFNFNQREEGRWPPNILLSEEAAVEMDLQSGIQKSGIAVQRNRDGNKVHNSLYFHKHPPAPDQTYGDTGGASRFFPIFKYCAKVPKSERNAGLKEPNNHPTVKPVELMRWLIRLVTPLNGVVLDPFMGSGSTGIAAIKEGVRFIGIEKDEHYYNIAHKRITYHQV